MVFFSFLSQIPSQISGITQQLSVMTLPFLYDKNLLNFFDINIEVLSIRRKYLFANQIVIVLVYFLAFEIMRRKNIKNFRLAISAFLAFATMLILNVYITPEALRSFFSSRYFFFPSTMMALFWGIFLATLLEYKSKKIKSCSVFILIFWLIYNFYYIKHNLKLDAWRHEANRKIIEAVKNDSETLKKEPYHVAVLGMRTLSAYGVHYIKRFYGHPDSIFYFDPPKIEDLAKQEVDPNKIFVYKYNYEAKKVINETEVYRTLLKNYYSSQ
jgi:hypothetical protein